MRIANHKGHRHCFAKRATQSQHHAADNANARVGQHHITHHFPGGAAKTRRSFL